ncbi:ABC transporter ATP-binding protein [Lachnoanaerobaculum umeaense]|jgi:oligopeptide/dipeptide ABC transporter, ATP-binding protein, C-terminal domain|uniref:ATP-binding cassette domain-containing protein n=1 Tax=Lachnoanaerobaculum umeaense TaxID=617123 RepID=A0A385Q053_9FIRM|nr:oligopeptide/dipeptide ABC transporter ATP-binding protein [Lachnoanaerobaculum umeaense]AYA99788.1 ATP-binding cassette domain-containing protein [Lachnoanaerobaculum umeaense]PZW97790.1 oligopeptide transport system ATP-binding protein [Lachnoanaerobaculum umeaense]
MRNVVLRLKNIVKEFPTSKKNKKVHAISNVSLDIYENETLALVGESGCGKSTLGKCAIGLISPNSGESIFLDENIYNKKGNDLKNIKKNLQIIFQDPYASLNPRMTVGEIIAEPIITHNRVMKKEDIKSKVLDLMEDVGIRKEYYNRYPHQFSGGQRQRIGIARAIALNPKLIVCDEPVSALDVSIQSQVLNLLKDLQEKRKASYLFISHDLSVVNFIADRVCVMFLGKICEIGNTDDIFENPLHPYTRLLLDAIPSIENAGKQREMLKGEIPSPIDVPSGCRFHTRCPNCMDICKTEEPVLSENNGRSVACHRVK